MINLQMHSSVHNLISFFFFGLLGFFFVKNVPFFNKSYILLFRLRIKSIKEERMKGNIQF